MARTYKQIQLDVINEYNIKIVEDSNSRQRMHAVVKKREIHKWHPKASFRATFDLFHEIGHIMTTKTSMRRCEAEFFATKWAIEQMLRNDLEADIDTMITYQAYIYMENARGVRRGGEDKKDMLDIFQYIGTPMAYEKFMEICPRNWARAIGNF